MLAHLDFSWGLKDLGTCFNRCSVEVVVEVSHDWCFSEHALELCGVRKVEASTIDGVYAGPCESRLSGEFIGQWCGGLN